MKGIICIGGKLDGQHYFLAETGRGDHYLPPTINEIDETRGANIDGRYPMRIAYRLVQFVDAGKLVQAYVSTEHPTAIESPLTYLLERYAQWVDMTQRIIRMKEG